MVCIGLLFNSVEHLRWVIDVLFVVWFVCCVVIADYLGLLSLMFAADYVGWIWLLYCVVCWVGCWLIIVVYSMF